MTRARSIRMVFCIFAATEQENMRAHTGLRVDCHVKCMHICVYIYIHIYTDTHMPIHMLCIGLHKNTDTLYTYKGRFISSDVNGYDYGYTHLSFL